MSEGKRKEKSNEFELSSNPNAIMDAAKIRSNSLSALANSADWVDRYFDKIQFIHKTFLSDLVVIYKRVPEVIAQAPNAGEEIQAKRYKIFLERIIRFLHMSKDDLMKQRKENVQRFMKEIVSYIERVKAKKSAALDGPSKKVSQAPIEPPPNPSKTLSLGDNQPSHSQTGDFLIQQEIRELNESLIETTVDVIDVDNSETGYIKGIVVRCLYNGPRCYEKIHMVNAPVRPFKSLLLELLVPDDYPNSTPIVLERLHPGRRESLETKALRKKAMSIFSSMLWKFSRPISLKNMAKTWDACARQECFEFAKKLGRGGDFMATYREKC